MYPETGLGTKRKLGFEEGGGGLLLKSDLKKVSFQCSQRQFKRKIILPIPTYFLDCTKLLFFSLYMLSIILLVQNIVLKMPPKDFSGASVGDQSQHQIILQILTS